MTLTGVGVLLIGIGFLVIAIFIAHALQNLAGVLKGVEKTMDRLPDQMDTIVKETGELMSESNKTLADVNDKLKQLSPLFYVVGDAGNISRKFSSSLVNITESLKEETGEAKEVTDKNKLGGLYGSFALGYYWLQRRREAKREKNENEDVK
nr:DUF948 domain-containing protein [Virgibacillus sp. YIM 98842]